MLRAPIQAMPALETAPVPADFDEGWSGPVDRLLGPMLPPAIMDVVGAPFVLAETLMSALVSSSQVLMLPIVLMLMALASRRFRRELASFLVGTDA